MSLAGVLRETLPFLRAVLPATIVMEEHLTPEASLVLADVTQLHQIVMNLGVNAEYAMRDTGGLLAVRLDAVEVDAALAATHPALRPGPYVRLTVRDSGAGIPPDPLSRTVSRTYGPGRRAGWVAANAASTSTASRWTSRSPPVSRMVYPAFAPRFIRSAASGSRRPAPRSPRW